jgi:hypothetical protein
MFSFDFGTTRHGDMERWGKAIPWSVIDGENYMKIWLYNELGLGSIFEKIHHQIGHCTATVQK